MKFILLLLLFVMQVLASLKAKEYILKAYGISKQETIKVSKNFNFSSYTSEGMWDDNVGDYGIKNAQAMLNKIITK